MSPKKKVSAETPIEQIGSGVEQAPEQEVEQVNAPISQHHSVMNESRRAKYDEWEQRQANADAIGKYASACNRHTLVDFTVVGIEPNSETGEVYWVGYEGPITIRVPFCETFDNLPEDLIKTTPSSVVVARRTQFLQRSIALRCKVLPQSMELLPDGSGAIVTASRVAASARIRRYHYGKDAFPAIKVGDRVTASVLAVGNSSLWLDVGGYELQVAQRHLTHRYIDNAKNYWAVGNTISVEVKSVITTGNPGEVSELQVTMKPLERKTALQYKSRIISGGKYKATVVSIVAQPKPTINLWLEGLEMPAFATSRQYEQQPISSGDKVLVKALGMRTEGPTAGLTACEINRILPPEHQD